MTEKVVLYVGKCIGAVEIGIGTICMQIAYIVCPRTILYFRIAERSTHGLSPMYSR